MSNPMMIKETRRGERIHVLLCGEVDAHEAAVLGDTLRGHIEAGENRILLEFGFGGFVSSTLIGLLIWLHRLALATGGEISLVRPPRILRRSLDTMGLEGLFRIEESVPAAVARATEPSLQLDG